MVTTYVYQDLASTLGATRLGWVMEPLPTWFQVFTLLPVPLVQ